MYSKQIENIRNNVELILDNFDNHTLDLLLIALTQIDIYV